MDTGENKPVKQEGNIESSSRWRSQEFRKSIVKKMMNIIIQKGCPSWAQNLSELSKCVERFEEKVYTSAKDEDDYIAKISAKVKALYLITQEAESKHLLSTSSSSGAGRTANIEWQEQIYEKVESSQKPMAQDLENCRHIKKIIENIFAILGVSKSQINTDFKEKLDNAEKWIDYIMQRINLSSYNQGQHSAEVQSGQHFLPPLSRNSREEIFEKNQSPQVLRTQNYHVTKQISQPKKLSLQQQPMAKQYSNSQHEANQMSITKGVISLKCINSLAQARGALKANEEFGISINTPGISASPMLKDCCNLNETSHKPTVISDEPSAAMQCLVKVLTSMSAEALSTSIDEIREIVYLNDVIPPSKLYGSLKRAHDQTQPSLVQQGRVGPSNILGLNALFVSTFAYTRVRHWTFFGWVLKFFGYAMLVPQSNFHRKINRRR
ncbi:putative coactivator CBP, KIX domain-containing protein [Lupinus albus]|uniref:Putative coactivator CBP, KIX domain-containing protein n=1 Tax=Lupinus albus TaxID=3870 RepID=A0A6A4NUM9_LUPAL|nr:putative coactivator CBP, KIX domain-containing protein [Lupinus albus]